MHARRALLALATLLLPALLAGCADRVDTAAAELGELKSGLESAKQEVRDARAQYESAKARYERVRSLTIVRTETVDLTLAVIYATGSRTATFVAEADRQGVPLPNENLTRLPLLDVQLRAARLDGAPDTAGAASFRCEAMTCAIVVPEGGAILLGWHQDKTWTAQRLADGTLETYVGGAWAPVAGAPALFRADTEVLATTSVSDAGS